MFNSSPQFYSHPACRLLELQLTFCNFSCCSWLCSTRTQILCSTRTQILCNFPPWVFKLLRVLDGVGVNPRLVANCWQAYVSAEITQDPASMDVTLKCKRPAHLTIGNMLQKQIATIPHIERRFENRLPQFCHQQFWVLVWIFANYEYRCFHCMRLAGLGWSCLYTYWSCRCCSRWTAIVSQAPIQYSGAGN